MIPLHDSVPTRRWPVLTIALIVANLAVFVWSQAAPTQLLSSSRGLVPVDGFTAVTAEYGFVPCELTMRCPHGDDTVQVGRFARDGAPAFVRVRHVPVVLTLFTSMFMHGGFLHIIGNMLFLWIFGNNVEDSMGRPRFVAYYLLGGLAALAGQVVFALNSTAPTIGASGAVAAVLGGYLVLFPRARILTVVFIIFFFTLIELPALVMLGLWFLQQIYFSVAELSDPLGQGSGVAYWAHIGGFVFGLLLIRAFATRRKEVPARFPLY
jgi:membrane associated rhomboid family serine protease